MISMLRLSVKDIAQAVRVSEGLVYDWINETRKFQPRYAQVLSLLYNVSESWLMTGEGEMFGEKGPRLPGVDPGAIISAQEIQVGPGGIESAKSVYWRALVDETRRERDSWRDQARSLAELLQSKPQEAIPTNAEGAAPLGLDSRPLNAEEMTLLRVWRNLEDAGLKHALLGTLRGEVQADALEKEQTDRQPHRGSQTGGKGR